MLSQLAASDWPQWRGPERTGISPETGLLKQWPSNGPELLWQIDGIGAGFSTPAIDGDRLYLLCNEGMEDEYVRALSVEDGSRVWSRKIGKVGHPDQRPNYPAARSTPTVDGARLYALGSDGDLVCLETDSGNVLWRKHLPADFGGKHGEWAYAESPLIDGDKVICTPGGGEATLLALNKHTGEVVWKSPVPGGDAAAYSSPIIVHADGVKQYVQFVDKGLVGVEAETGEFLWRYDKTAEDSPANIPTPVSKNGYVYSASGRGGGGLVKLQKNGESVSVEEIYAASKLPKAIGGSVLVGDYLYGTTGNALLCVEFTRGEVKWEARSIAPASLCYADGRLYLHGENGEVALVEATPERYNELGHFTPPDLPDRGRAKAWAYPVVADGRLYIRDVDRLWCYDIKR